MERELIKSEDGHIVGEIIQEGDMYQVWKKEKPQFPPRQRNTLLGACENLDEARRLAEQLKS